MISVLLILAFAGSAAAFNLMDLRNSPLKSLLALQKAAQKHDTEEFQKYIYLESFIGRVYDDGIAAVAESGSYKLVTYTSMTGIHKLVRPQIIPYAKKCVLEHIAGTDKKETKKPVEKEGILGSLLDKAARKKEELIEKFNPANILKETIDFDHSKIKKVATHKKTKEGAIVAVTIYNTELKQNFVLRLSLEPIGRKGWRVIEPINFKEYVIAVDRAKKIALHQTKM